MAYEEKNIDFYNHLIVYYDECSKDDAPSIVQVTQQDLDGTTWSSNGVRGMFAFKGNRIAYGLWNRQGTYLKEIKYGTYSVDDGILRYTLDGESAERTIKCKYDENGNLMLSMDEKVYDDFPYGVAHKSDYMDLFYKHD